MNASIRVDSAERWTEEARYRLKLLKFRAERNLMSSGLEELSRYKMEMKQGRVRAASEGYQRETGAFIHSRYRDLVFLDEKIEGNTAGPDRTTLPDGDRKSVV